MFNQRLFKLWPLATVIVGAALLRLYGIDWGLPGIYEEATPFYKAWAMWGWGTSDRVDLNPHFFNYPSLIIYVQFLLQGVVYTSLSLLGTVGDAVDFRVLRELDPSVLIVSGRVVNTLFALGGVLFTALAGQRVAGRSAGLMAGALLAVNATHIARSQKIEVDVPLTCFVALSFWLMFRALETPKLSRFLAAGCAIGLAASSKYTGAFLVLPLTMIVLSALREGRSPRELGRAAFLPLAASLSLAALVFLATSPFVLLDWRSFWEHFSLERLHMSLGHFGAGVVPSWRYYPQLIADKVLGYPAALLLVAGVVYLVMAVRRVWVFALLAFLVPYAVIVGTWSMQAECYVLPALPAMCLLLGGIVAGLLGEARRRGLSPRLALPLGLLAGLVLMGTQVPSTLRLIDGRREDNRALARAWIEENIPAGSYIVSELQGPDLLSLATLADLETRVREALLERTKSPVFATQIIPMFQMAPQWTEPYYDLDLYAMADYVITTGAVRDRFEVEPERYARQVAFYRKLEESFEKIREFDSPGSLSFKISIYQNPTVAKPFASRATVGPPPPLSGLRPENRSLQEATFYYALGINYEALGHTERALESYRMGFEVGLRPDLFGALALSVVRTCMTLDRVDEAVTFLGWAETNAPSEVLRREFSAMRLRLRAAPGSR